MLIALSTFDLRNRVTADCSTATAIERRESLLFAARMPVKRMEAIGGFDRLTVVRIVGRCLMQFSEIIVHGEGLETIECESRNGKMLEGTWWPSTKPIVLLDLLHGQTLVFVRV